MSIQLNANISSLNAQRGLFNATSKVNKSLERLSTGYKFNKAGDGTAELSIASYFQSQTRGAKAAMKNVETGMTVLNIADGALQGVEEHLQRIREITLSVAGSGVTTDQYAAANAEITARVAAVNDIANSTNFNGTALLDGSTTNFRIQAGANSAAVSANDVIDIGGAFGDNTYATIAGAAAIAISDNTTAGNMLAQIDTAIGALATNRAAIGQRQNILTDRLSTLQVQHENYSAAEATIRNTDVAEETARLTQNQILQQAAAAALAQANQMPSIALMLLGK